MLILLLQLSLFFSVYILVILFRPFVGLYDPLLRALIWPIAGLINLLFNQNLFTVDGLLFFFVLLWVIFLSTFYSTPHFIPSKLKPSPRVMFISKALILLSLIFTTLNLYLNVDLSNSAYSVSTFDLRGDFKYPFLYFLTESVTFPLILLFFIFRHFNSPSYARIVVLDLFLYLLPSLLQPGKSTLLSLLFFALDLTFFKNFVLGNPLLSPMLRNAKLSKNQVRNLTLISLPLIILLLFTILFISSVLRISIDDSIELFVFRLFSISYDLPFAIINSSTIHIGLNDPPPEFHTFIELWLKPIFTNLFGISYIHDTIPKYFEPLLYAGRSSYGASSPNSNLFLEFSSIHGASLGILFFLILTGIAARIRKVYLRSNTLTIRSLLFIPMLSFGPLFSFQSGQPFFTSYIPYIVIILSLSCLFDILRLLGLMRSRVFA